MFEGYQSPRGDEMQPLIAVDMDGKLNKYQSPRGDEMQLKKMAVVRA